MARGKISDMGGFELGTPALVCRWRLSRRHLPLQNRHLRALQAREVAGTPVKNELVAWAKQHLEWTLEQGSVDYPDGVLMLIVDEEGRAAMTVGPYESLAATQLAPLMDRAVAAAEEGEVTLVAPETLWIAQGDTLCFDPGTEGAVSGATSLVVQLAQTMGLQVVRNERLLESVRRGLETFDEAFLVSDEHGVVPASDATGRHGLRMAQGYQRLLDQA